MVPKLMHRDPLKKMKLWWVENVLVVLWLYGWIKKYPLSKGDTKDEK